MDFSTFVQQQQQRPVDAAQPQTPVTHADTSLDLACVLSLTESVDSLIKELRREIQELREIITETSDAADLLRDMLGDK